MPDLRGPDPEFAERLWARVELEAFGPARVEVGTAEPTASHTGRRALLVAAASVAALLVLVAGNLQTDPRAVDDLDVAEMLPTTAPTPEPDDRVDGGDPQALPALPGPIAGAAVPAPPVLAADRPAAGRPASAPRRPNQRPVVAQAPAPASGAAQAVLDQLLFGYDTPEDNDYELATMALDDEERVVVLTENDGAHDFQADWAPDGRRIVFGSRYRNGHDHIQIYVREPDGTERRLTEDTCDESEPICGDTHPSWSPTGDVIAFTRGGAYAGCQPSLGQCGTIMLVPPAGGTPVALTPGWRGSWSPDGRRLVFVTARDDVGRVTCDDYLTGCVGDLHVINRDGTGLRALGVKGDNPRWSPDGRWIAYSGRGAATGWQVRITAADGSAGTRDVGRTGHTMPAWSPDGRSLVTVKPTGGAYDLWLTDLASGESLQITHTPAIESLPVFRPRPR